MDTDGFTTCLWFDDGQAEEAAQFYVSVFGNSKLGEVVRNTDATPARRAPCSPWSSRPTARGSSP